MTPLALHLPDEPVHEATLWQDRVAAGEPFDSVLIGEGSIAAWLELRWRALRGVGIDSDAFAAIVGAMRRELWLWLRGERTWESVIGALLGRLERRIEH